MIDLDKLARLIALNALDGLADIDAMAIAEAAEEPLTAEQIGQIYERLGRIIAALRRSLAAEATADGRRATVPAGSTPTPSATAGCRSYAASGELNHERP